VLQPVVARTIQQQSSATFCTLGELVILLCVQEVVATRIQQQPSAAAFALKDAFAFGAALLVVQPVVARMIQQQSFAWFDIKIRIYKFILLCL
jgi:hypothetical protein